MGASRPADVPASQGRVVALWVADAPSARTRPVEEVEAVAGAGLCGDRHFDPAGKPAGQQATLVEAEALRAAEAEHGVVLGDGLHRRQIVTDGVALNDLVGRQFTVGAARLRGVKLCEPCRHMATLAGQKDAIRALAGRGGLNAEILRSGQIRVGDPVTVTGGFAGGGQAAGQPP